MEMGNDLDAPCIKNQAPEQTGGTTEVYKTSGLIDAPGVVSVVIQVP